MAFMAINILLAINTHHKFLRAIFMKKVMFLNKQEFVSNTQNLL
jgi:hypothetical protein